MANTIFYIGLFSLLHQIWKAVQFAYIYLHRPSTPLARYKRGDNSWALITGGSDGIGFGFAQALRSQGWNLIILAHGIGKLNDAKRSLELEFPGDNEVKVLLFDAMIGSAEELEKVVESISDLPITLLVNNVGGVPIASPHFRQLSQYQLQEIDDTMALNSRFMARLTCLMLPILVKNGPSLIANMSSGAQSGIPWLVMYSATKGFVKAFSYALSRELRAEKVPVDVINMNPGDTRSFQHQAPLAWNVPTSGRLAAAAVDNLGTAVKWGYLEWSPFWVHGILVEMLDRMPEWMRQAALADEIQKKHRMFDKEE